MSDASRVPQQVRSRATRSALLEAAVECLVERGWSGSTVAVVAERAGVSRGAAQHHFPTREDLFVAAVGHVAAERQATLRDLADAGDGQRLTTRAVVDVVVDLYTGPMFQAALVLWAASATEPLLREQVVPLETRIGREVHRLAVDLLGVDEAVPGVREAIQITLDLARGLGLSNLLTDDSRRRQGIVGQWSDMLDASLPPR